MPQPIARTEGVAFAFPCALQTPTPGGPVPIPYPNIAQLGTASGASTDVTAGGQAVLTTAASVPAPTSGGEAGTASAPDNTGDCTFAQGSSTVTVNGHPVVRMLDPTQHCGALGYPGQVMVGLPTVVVGG